VRPVLNAAGRDCPILTIREVRHLHVGPYTRRTYRSLQLTIMWPSDIPPTYGFEWAVLLKSATYLLFGHLGTDRLPVRVAAVR
jgi:hypothetical protein